MTKHDLKLQPDKCDFLRKEAAFLGHVIKDGDKNLMRRRSKLLGISKFPLAH
jgi:hypothetical protein